MKTIINILVISFFILGDAASQTLTLESKDLLKIEVNYIYGKIKITGTGNNQINIIAGKHKSVPKEFNSLRFDLKESNTKLDLYIENDKGVLKIYPASIEAKLADYIIEIPNNLKVKVICNSRDLKNRAWTLSKVEDAITDTIFISNMLNDIEIESKLLSTLKIHNISGPIVVNSYFADIYIQFLEISQLRPSHIKTFRGDIYLSLSQYTDCDIEQNSYSGTFNSEFDIHALKVEPH